MRTEVIPTKLIVAFYGRFAQSPEHILINYVSVIIVLFVETPRKLIYVVFPQTKLLYILSPIRHANIQRTYMCLLLKFTYLNCGSDGSTA